MSDSEISSGFICGETKSMYLCCFGIVPYLQTLLENKVKNGPFVTFDESLNRQLAKKQLDIHVRFWDHNSVESRSYIDSQQVETKKRLKSEKRKPVELEVEAIRKKQKQLENDIASLSSDV